MALPTTETLGQRIKRLRESITVTLASGEQKKMTQEILAERCNCDVSTIYRIENGRQEPTLCVAKSLANALGVSLDYLAETC